MHGSALVPSEAKTPPSTLAGHPIPKVFFADDVLSAEPSVNQVLGRHRRRYRKDWMSILLPQQISRCFAVWKMFCSSRESCCSRASHWHTKSNRPPNNLLLTDPNPVKPSVRISRKTSSPASPNNRSSTSPLGVARMQGRWGRSGCSGWGHIVYSSAPYRRSSRRHTCLSPPTIGGSGILQQ